MASPVVTRAAGLIIYRQIANEVQFLLLQTSYGEHHWTPPKGHLDPGESDFEAALRETKEEAGLAEHQLRIIESFTTELHYEVRGKPKTVTYWLSEIKDAESAVTLSHEHTDYKWLNLQDALKYAKYTDMQKALNEANNFIQK